MSPHKKFSLHKLMKSELVLITIIFFALILRLIFFTGVNTSDDVIYHTATYDILTGKFRPGWALSLRIMLLYPIAFFFRLFGINNFSAGLWPLICSLGTLIITYKIGELTFNKKVGLLAAFLFSFYPLEVIYGTRLAADVPTEFFLSMSVLLFIKGLKEKNNSKIFYFLAGISLGLSYLVKELGLLLFVFYFTYIILDTLKKRKINWDYIFIFLGFLLLFCLEGIYYYSVTGDFLHRFHEAVKIYSGEPCGGRGTRPIDILTFYPPAMLNLADYYPFPNTRIYGFFFYFVFASMVYLLFKKERRAYILILWFLTLFLYLEAGTRSLTRYLIFSKEMRFLTIISVPSMVLIAAFLTYNKNFIKFLMPLSLFFLLTTSLFYINILSYYLEYGMGECGCMRINDIKQIAEFIKSNPTSKFYVEESIYDNVRFFLAYNATNLRTFNGMNESDMKDSYVIINTSQIFLYACNFEREKSREKIPDFVCDPPKEWELVKIIGGKEGTLNREYNPAIYYVR